jgi:hypothetical protein
VARDNDLILDLESVAANGERDAVEANPKRVESRGDDDIIGAIVGAIHGGESRGRTVRVPRDSVVSFRLERAPDVGVPDRGYDRDGWHYRGRDDRHDRDQRRDDDRRDRDQRRDDDRRNISLFWTIWSRLSGAAFSSEALSKERNRRFLRPPF